MNDDLEVARNLHNEGFAEGLRGEGCSSGFTEYRIGWLAGRDTCKTQRLENMILNKTILTDIMQDTLNQVPEPSNFKEYRESFKIQKISSDKIYRVLRELGFRTSLKNDERVIMEHSLTYAVVSFPVDVNDIGIIFYKTIEDVIVNFNILPLKEFRKMIDDFDNS